MKLTRLAPFVAAALALVGCANSPSVAATVGDTQITQAQVTAIVEACPQVGVNQVIPATGVMALVREALFLEVARKQNTSITDVEIDQMLSSDSQVAQLIQQQPGCRGLFVNQAIMQVLLSKIPGAQARQVADQTKIVLNPRYGSWDANELAPMGSGSISLLAAALNR